MKHIFTSVIQAHLATVLLIAISVGAYGCADSATVNPVVELASLTVTPGTLQPTFDRSTTQYSVDLTSNIASVTITAQPAVAGDSVSINGVKATSRVITLGPAGSTTSVNIAVSESDSNSRAYTVLITRAGPGGNNSLDNLTVSPGILAPTFNANELIYTVDVTNTVPTVEITPTLQDPAATMRVNGQAATSGLPQTITLNGPGQSTPITIIVTAQNGNPKPYLVTVNRGKSGNNLLANLTISPGSLAFSPGTTAYTVNLPSTLPSTITNVIVTPTVQDPTASMTINGAAATSGQPRNTPLPAPGSTSFIAIVVTAENGTSRLYTVNVVRDPLSGNNNLQSLAVSPGSLIPAFDQNSLRTSFTVSVAGNVDTVTVSAVPQDPAASLRFLVNGVEPPSSSIPLPNGPSSTEIEIVVTAQNGSQKQYLITVNRAALMAPPAPTNAPDMTTATDSGIPDDNITNITTPSFTVSSPAAGETPSIYVNGIKAQDATFDLATSTFTLTTPLSEGLYEITSTLANAAGESSQSPSLTVTIDALAPGTP